MKIQSQMKEDIINGVINSFHLCKHDMSQAKKTQKNRSYVTSQQTDACYVFMTGKSPLLP